MEFLAFSEASKMALKTATLVKGVNVSTLISGEIGTGKSILAKYILPGAVVIDGGDSLLLKEAFSKYRNIIIENFENIYEINSLDFNFETKKIVATTSKKISENIVDRFFGVEISLPPLCERKEDILPLAKLFLNEAKNNFRLKNESDLNKIEFDISQNCHSLKKSVYLSTLVETMSDKEIVSILESFLANKITGNSDYRNFLYLYDIPIIKASNKKFHSQFKMAEKLGINRNTLRKKIRELSIKLDKKL